MSAGRRWCGLTAGLCRVRSRAGPAGSQSGACSQGVEGRDAAAAKMTALATRARLCDYLTVTRPLHDRHCKLHDGARPSGF
jgi:hypothetical protein